MIHKSFINGKWSEWEQLGGKLYSAPAAMQAKDKPAIHVFSADKDGIIVKKSFTGDYWDARQKMSFVIGSEKN